MCGICGIFNYRQNDLMVKDKQLQTMAKALQHRGPDDEGFYIDGNLGLGHKRLSIIDLTESGRQPMQSADGRYWIILNGEIYNYLELREELKAKGYHFCSSSDTEVLLYLYAEQKQECLNSLNGMFAFVVWDSKERTLFAARDRLGIKPFYYFDSGYSLYFASEIKALLKATAVQPEIDMDSLYEYLTFQFCLGSKTLFKNIFKLMPGHSLLLEQGRNPIINKYWDIDFNIDTFHTEDYFKHELLHLLEDTVRLQLRSDVPVGAHLSGGLDSSTVTSLASSFLDTKINTFSGGFREGKEFDETNYARIVSEKVGSTHHEVFPTAKDFVDLMPGLIYQMDEPVAGPGLFPQFKVSELAGRFVKVVLGGQGGDEIFGGYTRYLIAYLEECIRGGIEGTQEESKYVVTFDSILPNLTQLQGYEPLLRYFWEEGLFDPPEKRYFRLIDRSSGIKDLFCEEFLNTGDNSVFERFYEIFNEGDNRSYINKMTRFDIKTLLPALLHVEDRTSMAVSLESRVPLLDHRIIELVASMPPMIKYKGGRSKHVFREVVKNITPPEILQRKDKMGFPVPLNKWYKKGPVREFVKDTLLGQKAVNRGIYKHNSVEDLLDSERSYGRAIWGILSLELWMQEFIDE